jgi:hypothetical protein
MPLYTYSECSSFAPNNDPILSLLGFIFTLERRQRRQLYRVDNSLLCDVQLSKQFHATSLYGRKRLTRGRSTELPGQNWMILSHLTRRLGWPISGEYTVPEKSEGPLGGRALLARMGVMGVVMAGQFRRGVYMVSAGAGTTLTSRIFATGFSSPRSISLSATSSMLTKSLKSSLFC